MRIPLQLIGIVLAITPLSMAQFSACEALPSDAKLVLNQRFSDWRPKQVSDLGGDDKKLWLEMHPRECPGIAVGHFEQRDRNAYALMLVPKAGHNGSYKIIVLTKGRMGTRFACSITPKAIHTPTPDW
jgi:hypothetical protein